MPATIVTHPKEEYKSCPHFTVGYEGRDIVYVSSYELDIAKGDKNSTRYTFQMPRALTSDIDVYKSSIRIHYTNILSGDVGTHHDDIYPVEDIVAVDSATGKQYNPSDVNDSLDNYDTVCFSWLLSAGTSVYDGSLNFAIQVNQQTPDAYYGWKSYPYTGISVGDTLDSSEDIEDQMSDMVSYWYEKFLISSITTENVIQDLVDKASVNIDNALSIGKASIHQIKQNAVSEITDLVDDKKSELDGISTVAVSATPPADPKVAVWIKTSGIDTHPWFKFGSIDVDTENAEGIIDVVSGEMIDSQATVTFNVNRLFELGVIRIYVVRYYSDTKEFKRIDKVLDSTSANVWLTVDTEFDNCLVYMQIAEGGAEEILSAISASIYVDPVIQKERVVSDCYSSNDSYPCMYYDSLRDTVYMTGVTATGLMGIAVFDLRNDKTDFVRLGYIKTETGKIVSGRDTVPALLMDSTHSPIVAYPIPNQNGVIKMRVGEAPYDIHSLTTAEEITVEFPGAINTCGNITLIRQNNVSAIACYMFTKIGNNVFIAYVDEHGLREVPAKFVQDVHSYVIRKETSELYRCAICDSSATQNLCKVGLFCINANTLEVSNKASANADANDASYKSFGNLYSMFMNSNPISVDDTMVITDGLIIDNKMGNSGREDGVFLLDTADHKVLTIHYPRYLVTYTGDGSYTYDSYTDKDGIEHRYKLSYDGDDAARFIRKSDDTYWIGRDNDGDGALVWENIILGSTTNKGIETCFEEGTYTIYFYKDLKVAEETEDTIGDSIPDSKYIDTTTDGIKIYKTNKPLYLVSDSVDFISEEIASFATLSITYDLPGNATKYYQRTVGGLDIYTAEVATGSDKGKIKYYAGPVNYHTVRKVDRHTVYLKLNKLSDSENAIYSVDTIPLDNIGLYDNRVEVEDALTDNNEKVYHAFGEGLDDIYYTERKMDDRYVAESWYHNPASNNALEPSGGEYDYDTELSDVAKMTSTVTPHLDMYVSDMTSVQCHEFTFSYITDVIDGKAIYREMVYDSTDDNGELFYVPTGKVWPNIPGEDIGVESIVGYTKDNGQWVYGRICRMYYVYTLYPGRLCYYGVKLIKEYTPAEFSATEEVLAVDPKGYIVDKASITCNHEGVAFGNVAVYETESSGGTVYYTTLPIPEYFIRPVLRYWIEYGGYGTSISNNRNESICGCCFDDDGEIFVAREMTSHKVVEKYTLSSNGSVRKIGELRATDSGLVGFANPIRIVGAESKNMFACLDSYVDTDREYYCDLKIIKY